MIEPPLAVFGVFGEGVEFIFEERRSDGGSGVPVGGLSEMSDLAGNHLAVSGLAVLIAVLVAAPIGMWLGHLKRAQFLAVGMANVGRAVPALAIIGFCLAWLGTGFTNVCFALTLLAIPPILTNAYVGIGQVDPDLVDAARGQGLSEVQIIRQVELPLALPTIISGIRLSTISVMATAIIAPEAGYLTLGEPILAFGVYGEAGQIGAAILVAVLTMAIDLLLAGLQRLITPKGLKIARADRRRPFSLPRRSIEIP